MRKIEWHEAGNRLYGSGSVERSSVAAHWWLLDRWLGYAHPHWEWWDSLWSRLIPYWGDPFCAAYCCVWSQFYHRRTSSEYRVEVGFAKLSQDYRDWYARENPFADDDEEARTDRAA